MAILGQSLVEASLSLLVLALWQSGVWAWSARSAAAQIVFDNEPVILVKHGVLRKEAMTRSRVSRAMLEQHLQATNVTELSSVRFAVLEAGGNLASERWF